MSDNIKKRSNTPEIRSTQLQESGPHSESNAYAYHSPSIKQLIQLLEARTEELEKSQALMRLALDSVSEGILVVSNHWEILDWNKRMLELWHVPESILAAGNEKLGLNFANKHVVSSESIIEEVARVYSQPEFTGDLAHVEFKDGRFITRSIQPYRVGKKIIGRVWHFRDITKQVSFEKSVRRQLFKSNGENIINVYMGLSLTKREAQCAFFLVRGMTAKAIAHKLNISPKTVEGYIGQIKDKFGCYGKAELIDILLTAYQIS